ncbi:MAG TPA: phospholipase D family protein [Opitutus sp.]|nr:phospholipase D family protein [Opitutus sp.]
MALAEQWASPAWTEWGLPFQRRNELGERFTLRWDRIGFRVHGTTAINVKVLLTVRREGGANERYLVDTDACEAEGGAHRCTRDFYLGLDSWPFGAIVDVSFAFVVHCGERSYPSQFAYRLAEPGSGAGSHRIPPVAGENDYQTCEVDAGLLQRDVRWFNHHFESLGVVPKFTRGVVHHPYHPKRYIHDRLDEMIRRRCFAPERPARVKVCVDCIDDADFVNHLLYAAAQGVQVQCVVDWRKMTLTRSENYVRLKRSGIELIGVFCSSRDPRVELSPDMHTKFIVFGDEDCLLGSFNITFDRWGPNWESGLSFRSYGVCRLLDNVFQSIRGGVIQAYEIDPWSVFNLLYTFGRHAAADGRLYRPHQAIISEIHRARRSLRGCLFHVSELRGDYNDSVIDALIAARRRGVDVQLILNGHIVREGDPGREYTMENELRRPLVPAVARLQQGGVPVWLAYGKHDQRVPYSPLHAKFCVIDERVVLEGSFNWYNTSVFSHDLLVVLADPAIARLYLAEFDHVQNCLRFPRADP